MRTEEAVLGSPQKTPHKLLTLPLSFFLYYFLEYSKNLVYINNLSSWMSVHHACCPQRQGEAIRASQTVITDACEPPCGHYE